MTFHRKDAMRGVVSPPIPLGTFDAMLKDGRAPKPDGRMGRVPLWRTETRERFAESLLGMAGRKPDAAAAEPTSPTP